MGNVGGSAGGIERRVLLGECEWAIPVWGAAARDEHDAVLKLSPPQWKDMMKHRLREGLDKTEGLSSPHAPVNYNDALTGTREDNKVEARAEHGQPATLAVSWRLEALRGKGSDAAEMCISRLPFTAHSYAHGGFMGASISMVEEPKWRAILNKLESKDVYQSCERARASKDLRQKLKIMSCLENSPVLCAYGLVRANATTQVVKVTVPAPSLPVSRPAEPPSQPMPAKSRRRLAGSKASLGSSGDFDLEGSVRAMQPEMKMIEPSEGDIGSSGGMMTMRPLTTRSSMDVRSSFASVVQRKRGSVEGKESLRHVWACQMWQSAARRLLLIRKRWRSATLAIIRQNRISSTWNRRQTGYRTNRYGYAPTALEWDLWLHPKKPWSLEKATVDHGSPGALVQQAIFTTLGMKACAGKLGSKHIRNEGMRPVEWLTAFGKAINTAVNKSEDKPLSLPEGSMESFYEVHVKVCSGSGLPAMDINSSDPYCRMFVEGSDLYLKSVKSSVKYSTLEPEWNEEYKIYPVRKTTGLSLVVEVWDKDIASGDDFMGAVQVDLDPAAQRQGETIRVKVALAAESLASSLNQSLNESASSGMEGGAQADEFAAVDYEGQATSPATTPRPPMPSHRGTLTFEYSVREVTALEAGKRLGIPEPAFQSCLAMLSDPGGLYLDVKSAYSTAGDLAQFCSTLKGTGITVKSVCSFSPAQLRVPVRGGKPTTPAVRFFHGLSGLENACDKGQIAPGSNVKFNGASFLMDPSKGDSEGGMVTVAKLGALDTMYVNRYQALVETYGFQGGIYVQEPDCCASCVEALTRLVTRRPDIFPLGFAYGHVPGYAVSALSMTGRGFASQQIVEEFQARAELSGKVQRKIKEGGHKDVSIAVLTSWLERLLYGGSFLMLHEQHLVMIMLSDIKQDTSLSRIVSSVGGVERIFLRFFEHYEATSPFTLHEAGFNFNLSKKLLRMFRDRGVFERLSHERKVAAATFFASPAVYGWGVTYVCQKNGCRVSLHKFAKEALLCVLESSTEEEFNDQVAALGGREFLGDMLRGRYNVSHSYNRRLRAVEDSHETYPDDPHYITSMVIQRTSARRRTKGRRGSARSADEQLSFNMSFKHRARKTAKGIRKMARKTACCVFTGTYVTILTLGTLSVFAWVVAIPRTLAPYWGRGWNKERLRGLAILLAMCALVGAVISVISVVGWILFADHEEGEEIPIGLKKLL